MFQNFPKLKCRPSCDLLNAVQLNFSNFLLLKSNYSTPPTNRKPFICGPLSGTVKQPPILKTRSLAINITGEQIKKAMRFIQFRRCSDPIIRLGLVSDDGMSYTDLSSQTSYPRNMVEFLRSDPSLCDIQKKSKHAKWECVDNDLELLPPLMNPEKIICIGLNYSDHCKEQCKEPPKEPMFFSKFASTLVGPTGNVVKKDFCNSLDWEVEMAVIIGKTAKNITKERAMDYVFGYSVAQDISEREWQKSKNGGQFLIGKSMDTFCPLGPSIVHKSLIPDPHNLIITCSINGEPKQSANTSQMVFPIDDMIYRLSKVMTLKPGDVLLTGTPAGVGMHRCPPEFLVPGDIIESEIENIGKLHNTVVAEEDVALP